MVSSDWDVSMASALRCIVVTPESTALEQDAEFVVLPLFDGEMGVALNHSPMIGRLGFGELRIRESANKTVRYYIDGGFVQVADNTVAILTNRAVAASTITEEAARKLLAEAQEKPLQTAEQEAAKSLAIDQARAQLRVAKNARL